MRWLRKSASEPLAISMSGIKLGDRLLIVGASDVPLMTALAAKAGLTGRTCIVDASEAVSTRSAAAVEREGVLVESFSAPYSSLPFEPGAFDVVVVRDVLSGMTGNTRTQLASEIGRVVRPGGRCVVIEGQTRSGLAAWLGGKGDEGAESAAGKLEEALAGAGFRGARTLAARDGMLFVEGVKPGSG